MKIDDPEVTYGTVFTYADYINFDFDEMVELIRGRIFRMSPAPRTSHQIILVNLTRVFSTALYKQKCQVFVAPFDIILPIADKRREKATTVVQPDLCVICNPAIIEEAGCFGVPDLIIEILSPSTSKKDFNDKYTVYEEAGVKEYWIVMPESKLIEVFHLVKAQYQRIHTYVDTDSITPITLPDLDVNLSEIFPE
jgi:Uma2 family endonuclease